LKTGIKAFSANSKADSGQGKRELDVYHIFHMISLWTSEISYGN